MFGLSLGFAPLLARLPPRRIGPGLTRFLEGQQAQQAPPFTLARQGFGHPFEDFLRGITWVADKFPGPLHGIRSSVCAGCCALPRPADRRPSLGPRRNGGWRDAAPGCGLLHRRGASGGVRVCPLEPRFHTIRHNSPRSFMWIDIRFSLIIGTLAKTLRRNLHLFVA